MDTRVPLIVGAALIAVGLAVGGYFVGDGFLSARLGDRYVTVKGLSERPVKADLAIWPISFVVTGNDLGAVYDQLQQDGAIVGNFLKAQGFSDEEIARDAPRVTDKQANSYNSGPIGTRFVVTQRVRLRTEKVDEVESAARKAVVLLERGVILSDDYGATEPVFVFTKLNDLKTDMVQEATEVARATAAQFAEDSGSKLGGIRRANQGVFQILARDDAPGISESSQVEKTVRVVSTLTYFLED